MINHRDAITLTATIRDFLINHPDFERDAFTGEVTGLEKRRPDYQEPDPHPETGIVQAELGQDGKPNYNNGPENRRLTTTGEDNFNQWFGRVPGSYKTVSYPLQFSYQDGCYQFEGRPFFPLDQQEDSYGDLYSQMFNPDGSLTAVGTEVIDRNIRNRDANQAFLTHFDGTPLTREELIRIYTEWNRDSSGALKAKLHNYGFTMEAATSFTYQGDEFFRFEGDDDLWIFIDNLLVIDLGGLHRTAIKTLDLRLADEQETLVRNLRHDLGIVQADDRLNLVLKKGMTYSLRIFYAERHTFDSNCCFYTSLNLVPQVPEPQPVESLPTEFQPIKFLPVESLPVESLPVNSQTAASVELPLHELQVRIDALQDAIEPSYPLPGLHGKFQIRISEPAPAGGLRVKYELVQEGRHTATHDVDYTVSPAQEVSIPEGQQSADILVIPKQDRTRDAGEAVAIRIAAGSSYTATKAQDTIHIRDAFSFESAGRIVCVAPIRTIIRREEEITIVRRVRKVEEIDVSAACPVNSTQVSGTKNN